MYGSHVLRGRLQCLSYFLFHLKSLLMYRLCILLVFLFPSLCLADDQRPRVIVETDAGGDPDDEQSLVRFLVYANEFDIEGIIANRPLARDSENKNPVRDGLGIVRAMIHAYGQCYPNLVK